MSVPETFVRLKPPVSQEQAAAFLTQSAKIAWGEAVADDLAPLLESIAKSMEIVSALEIADDVEPLFGENASTAEVFS
ncbi:MAG: hypothetical protein EON56_01185 [Alphaproteobacteria bacterium]|nr:MAG: hypothetical protein EON56_01185 [Alphaproteobacteria bacterium]